MAMAGLRKEAEYFENNYIIRIYRYDKAHPRRIVGTAERVGDQDKRAFTNLDELWVILNPDKKKERRRKDNHQ